MSGRPGALLRRLLRAAAASAAAASNGTEKRHPAAERRCVHLAFFAFQPMQNNSPCSAVLRRPPGGQPPAAPRPAGPRRAGPPAELHGRRDAWSGQAAGRLTLCPPAGGEAARQSGPLALVGMPRWPRRVDHPGRCVSLHNLSIMQQRQGYAGRPGHSAARDRMSGRRRAQPGETSIKR